MADEQPKIEIFQSDAPVHGWTIRVDERYHDHLTFGEMLETLVFLTRDGVIGEPIKAPYGGMKTASEFADERRRWERPRNQEVVESGQSEPIDAEFQSDEAKSK